MTDKTYIIRKHDYSPHDYNENPELKEQLNFYLTPEIEDPPILEEALMISRKSKDYIKNLLSSLLSYTLDKMKNTKHSLNEEINFYLRNLMKVCINILNTDGITNVSSDKLLVQNFVDTKKGIEKVIKELEDILEGKEVELDKDIDLKDNYYLMLNVKLEDRKVTYKPTEEEKELYEDMRYEVGIIFKDINFKEEKTDKDTKHIRDIVLGIIDTLCGLNVTKDTPIDSRLVTTERIVKECALGVNLMTQLMTSIGNSHSFRTNESIPYDIFDTKYRINGLISHFKHNILYLEQQCDFLKRTSF